MSLLVENEGSALISQLGEGLRPVRAAIKSAGGLLSWLKTSAKAAGSFCVEDNNKSANHTVRLRSAAVPQPTKSLDISIDKDVSSVERLCNAVQPQWQCECECKSQIEHTNRAVETSVVITKQLVQNQRAKETSTTSKLRIPAADPRGRRPAAAPTADLTANQMSMWISDMSLMAVCAPNPRRLAD